MSYQFLRNKRNWIDKASFCFKRITSYITQLNTLVYTNRGIYSDLGDKGEARPVGLFPVFQQRLSHWQHSHVTRYGTTKTNSRSRFSCFIMQHPLCHPLFTWKFPSAFKPMYKYNHSFGDKQLRLPQVNYVWPQKWKEWTSYTERRNSFYNYTPITDLHYNAMLFWVSWRQG